MMMDGQQELWIVNYQLNLNILFLVTKSGFEVLNDVIGEYLQ